MPIKRTLIMEDKIFFQLGQIHSDVRFLKGQLKHILARQIKESECLATQKEKILQLPCKENGETIKEMLGVLTKYQTESEIRKKRNIFAKWTIGTVIAIVAIAVPVFLHYF